MCEDCRERLERNVWRILDCKNPECQKFIESAPDAASLFGEESKEYFKRVCGILSDMGVPFEIEPRLVRGLDYYVHTVFELSHPGLGAQNAIAGGGRYELNLPGFNRPVQGVGFAAGMERLLMARESRNVVPEKPAVPEVFLLSLGAGALEFNGKLAAELRRAGISTTLDFEAKSMKSQMRAADRLQARHVLIVGDSELASGEAVLKCMADGSQKTVSLSAVKDELSGK